MRKTSPQIVDAHGLNHPYTGQCGFEYSSPPVAMTIDGTLTGAKHVVIRGPTFDKVRSSSPSDAGNGTQRAA